jgi:hypothetical protein
MTGLSEFIADAIGLVCAMASWVFMFVLPIGFLALALTSGTRSPSLVAAESSIAILIGLLAHWLASGILKRGRVPTALTFLLCLVVGLRKVAASLNTPAVNMYLALRPF